MARPMIGASEEGSSTAGFSAAYPAERAPSDGSNLSGDGCRSIRRVTQTFISKVNPRSSIGLAYMTRNFIPLPRPAVFGLAYHCFGSFLVSVDAICVLLFRYEVCNPL